MLKERIVFLIQMMVNLNENQYIKTFQIDYSQEVMMGTELHIHTKTEDNLIIAKGIGDDEKKKFACQIILENL